jgi:7-cyano-7-deazaguanine reductase
VQNAQDRAQRRAVVFPGQSCATAAPHFAATLAAIRSKLPQDPIMPSHPVQSLEVFANPCPQRDYHIHMQIPEFTCLCPKTGQPDFATLYLDYIPDRQCVELKSLKLYIWSYRNEGTFHEAVTNKILDDLVAATAPRFMRVTARFFVRGGIFTTIAAEHRKSGWEPQARVELAQFAAQSNTQG